MLTAKATLNYKETPLRELLADLSVRFKTSIHLDEQGLANAMVHAAVPVTISVSNVTLKAGLKLILQPLRLDAAPRDGLLVVTDLESLKKINVLVGYPVADLILSPRGGDVLDGSASLIRLITETVDKDVWEVNGGDGTVLYFRPALLFLINASPDTHEKVAELLAMLRKTQSRVNEILKNTQWRDRAELLSKLKEPPVSLAVNPPASPPPEAALQIAAEAKRVADAAMRLSLRLEAEMIRRDQNGKPQPRPDGASKKGESR
jgi:hypothetical protein